MTHHSRDAHTVANGTTVNHLLRSRGACGYYCLFCFANFCASQSTNDNEMCITQNQSKLAEHQVSGVSRVVF